MTKTSFLIITIFVSTFSKAQQPFSKAQQNAQKVVVRFFEALSNLDSISLKKYCTADIILHEYGQVWNLDTLINKTITMNSAVTKNSKQIIIQWLESVILAKENKKWKVKHLHSTRINK